MMETTEVQPFHISIPEVELDDLYERLYPIRYTDDPIERRGEYGVPVRRLKHLVDYLFTEYDWRDWEAVLNSYPQSTAGIDGQRIHYLHVRSPEPDAVPLLLAHGWPGSVAEFTGVIEPLIAPKFYGCDGPAFDLVIPSLPGFGFSGPAKECGWGTVRTAAAYADLMKLLGYPRYGVHGNNAGALIAAELARVAADHVIGMHVNQVFPSAAADSPEFGVLTEREHEVLLSLRLQRERAGQPDLSLSRQPRALAPGLADSPLGLLAWTDQMMGESCSDCFVLTNTLIAWLTGTAASSIEYCYADLVTPPRSEPTRVPTACSNFLGGYQSVRRVAERDHQDIVQWRDHHMGGRYPDHEVPYLVIDDLRDCFGRPGRI